MDYDIFGDYCGNEHSRCHILWRNWILVIYVKNKNLLRTNFAFVNNYIGRRSNAWQIRFQILERSRCVHFIYRYLQNFAYSWVKIKVCCFCFCFSHFCVCLLKYWIMWYCVCWVCKPRRAIPKAIKMTSYRLLFSMFYLLYFWKCVSQLMIHC